MVFPQAVIGQYTVKISSREGTDYTVVVIRLVR